MGKSIYDNYEDGDLFYGDSIARHKYSRIPNELRIDDFNSYIVNPFSRPNLYKDDGSIIGIDFSKIVSTILKKNIQNISVDLIIEEAKAELLKIDRKKVLLFFTNGPILKGSFFSIEFIDMYLDLLLEDKKSKFSIANSVIKACSIDNLTEMILRNFFTSRLCKLGMEWCLINKRKIHFLIPKESDVLSWSLILRSKKYVYSISYRFTDREIVHLFKHYDRYKNVVIFYDRENGMEIDSIRLKPIIEKVQLRVKNAKFFEASKIDNEFDEFIQERIDVYKNEDLSSKGLLELEAECQVIAEKIKQIYKFENNRGYERVFDKRLKEDLYKCYEDRVWQGKKLS